MLDIFLDDGVQMGSGRCRCEVERPDKFSEWCEPAAKGRVCGWGLCRGRLCGLETRECTTALRVSCDDNWYGLR